MITQALAAAARVQEQYPAANWAAIAGSAVLAWVQPIAGVIAIVWGLLQIYLAVEKRWFRKQ